ncbi:MAG TPA: hypothetical protein VNL34_03345 [Candidatus Nitrosotenuis sp.]|nr:hypothetical protein [Candidatus Nitrosotenuis sp.]
MKLHTKEAHDDVIERLTMELGDEIGPQIINSKSLADIEKGKFYSLAEVEKELDIATDAMCTNNHF